MNKNTKNVYDEWAKTYDDAPHILHSLERDLVTSLVGPRKGDNILDAACGIGAYATVFVDKGASVTGVDISGKMLDIARQKAPGGKFITADIEKKLPFGDGVFNKISCSQAFQHIGHIAPILKEFKRLTKIGGTIVFSAPHPEMDRTYYKRSAPGTKLKERAVLFDHKFYEYFEAIEKVVLGIVDIKQIPITEKVEQFFEPEIFAKIEGKYLGVVFKLTR